ncbi:MAG: hypothetical protein K1X88_03540 [Nannocystaceae bacterium]|nr:hypothetical protein [Nannocystaceae bacterium]
MLVLVAAACADGSAGDGGGSGGDSSVGGSEGPRAHATPVDLVAPGGWSAAPGDDPMPDHAPAQVQCELGFGDEIGLFEVDTALCNYGVFSQPILDEVYEGDVVEFVLTHDDLVAPEPATGHLLFVIGGETAFDVQVPIPKAYDIVQGSWTPPAAIAAGTPVTLHIHNHGYNNWRVVSIEAHAP